MGFKLLLLTEGLEDGRGLDRWPDLLRQAVPDIDVAVCDSTGEAMEVIGEVDAAFGHIGADLFQRATRLRWLACPQAGPKAGYYHTPMIESDVVVTNVRGIYNDHISAHIISFVLAFARGLPTYMRRQLQAQWQTGQETVYLPESTALIVGAGGIGGETARLCAEFGMTVLAVDPRVTERPPGVAEMHGPQDLNALLPRADFVIVTVPETPESQGMFAAETFRLMKASAFFINIGRGATVVLEDLDQALRTGQIAGAGLDVFQIEPLPADHPLWSAPGALITPHVAAAGPYLDERRTELFIDNCVRFDQGRPLRNVVDKAHWF